MRRRGLLHIGVSGLVATLAQGCARGSDATRPGGGTGSSEPSPAASRFDPSTYQPPQIAFEVLKKLFVYDAKASLDAALTDERTGDGIVLEDLTFADTKGGTVAAYVIGPATSAGRLPGVVFAPGSDAGRDVLLPEASELARRGALVLVPELPMPATGDPAGDSNLLINTVVAQRRGLDLLARRSDVDATRLAFLGHSWGGMQAQILTGVEPRLSAVAVIAAGSRFSQYLASSTRTANPIAYLDALTRFDGARYVRVPGKRSMLLQFGKRDTVLPAAQFDELAELTAGAKERKDYEAGHDLIGFAPAVADRLAFLRKVLRLG